MVLEGPPDAAAVDEAAQAFGLLVVDEATPEPPELWQEHVPAVNLYIALLTQWRWGPAARTGLDYSVLPLVERRIGMTAAQARESFPHLRQLEAAALDWYREKGG